MFAVKQVIECDETKCKMSSMTYFMQQLSTRFPLAMKYIT